MYSKLRGRIVEKFGTFGKFADFIGITKQSASMKLNGKVKFTLEDVVAWSEALGIPKEEMHLYFFAC